MRKQQEIFTAVSIVCHRYERLAVLQNGFAIILIWTRKDVEKLFKETVYKCDKEKEKKQRRKEAFGTYTMPKLAQIVEQSSGTRKLCVSVFFFFSGHSIKQIDSMLPWVCSVIDHRRKKRKWHTLLLLVCHFFVFTTFWRHLWTITEQTHSNMESMKICWNRDKPTSIICMWQLKLNRSWNSKYPYHLRLRK